jgi:NADH dehydrogenase
VDVRLNTSVVEVTAQGLRLSVGMPIPSNTIIWAAGVKPIIPHFEGTMPALLMGRLAVDHYFRVNGDEHIFALGDTAGYVDADSLGTDPTKTKTLPMLAQVAEAQATTVANNIIATMRSKKLVNFHFHSKGSMVSVGQWFALGEIFSMAISGRLTWWIWRTVYLFKFASWKKRTRIAFEWTLDMFYPRDITKLT